MLRKYDDMLNRFDTIPERDRRTDERTDRIAISISPPNKPKEAQTRLQRFCCRVNG